MNTKGTVKMQDGQARDTSARESSVFRKEGGVIPLAEVVGKI